ncbi:nitrite reductase (NADH) small subunit [Halospina denitrificans]|uniref:Nitrite reductase (NADH) small subunit n=1 Tax=Halospina denitrificans TaxID=332522 RepID=A0A4R7JTM3_9GAMM|nr:nitrite reductase small subunit NirD [Halospina denitrificans]TDT40239.1 nitrite reductase (NADH) small subunit [Halospina denitrificans]
MTQSDNNWTTIGRLSDLVVGSGVGARYRDRQVAVFLIPELDDRVLVVDNYCPISGVNIIARGIVGDIQGEPVVATPLYKKHFSLLDGRCIEDDSHQLATYAVRVDGDEVQVAESAEGTGAAA